MKTVLANVATATMLAFVAAAATATTGLAQTPSTSPTGASWMRYPAISPDGRTIAFIFKGDPYKVSSAGGAATPLQYSLTATNLSIT